MSNKSRKRLSLELETIKSLDDAALGTVVGGGGSGGTCAGFGCTGVSGTCHTNNGCPVPGPAPVPAHF